MCILLKSRLKHPFALQKFLDEFMISFSKIDQEANQRITFAICNQHLTDLDVSSLRAKSMASSFEMTITEITDNNTD